MSATSSRQARVNALCPTHNVRFELRDPHRVSCEAAAHDLGQGYPLSGDKWEFCPKCSTVWPYQGRTGVTRCLYCEREVSERRFCINCSVMVLTDNDGRLPIVCPACFTSDGHSREHICEEAGRFLTGRAQCPFCEQPVVAPNPETPPPASPSPAESRSAEARSAKKKPPAATPTVTVTAVRPHDTPRVPMPPMAITPARTAAPRSLKLIITGTVGVLALVLYLVVGPASFERKINRALSAGNYFSPPGESVYDLYTDEARKNPESKEVRAAAVKIRNALEGPARADLELFYRDSVTKIGWSDLERYFAFLATLAPNVPDFQVRHAYAEGQRKLTKDQDHRGALEAYSRALKIDPRFALALNGVAKVYIQDTSPIRDEQMAIYYYERAAAADPNFTWPLKNLGEIYMRHSEWAKAEHYMTLALRTSPERPSILISMGRISFNLRRFREAENYYKRAHARSTDPQEIIRIESALQQIRRKLNG